MSKINWGFDNHILWMTVAAVLAVVIGVVTSNVFDTTKIAPDVVQLVGMIGDVWLRALRAIVLPLIFTSMVISAHSLSKIPDGAKKIVSHTLTYYFTTTILSCIEGLLISYFFIVPFVESVDISKLPKSISGLSSSKSEDDTKGTALEQIISVFISIIPTNVFAAFSQDDFMGVILTGLVIGLLIRDEKKRSTILDLCLEVDGYTKKLIAFLICVAPIGVFFLILPNLMVLNIGEVIKFVGVYILACIGGAIFHFLIVLPTIFLVFAKRSPVNLYQKSVTSMITAFGTASSAATLPVTMEAAQEYGIPDHISKFAINLGTTCNMNGAAIGFPIAVIFQGAALGISFSVVDYVVIVVTSVVAAIGASPIPSGGLIMILMIMSAVNVPATAFGLIIVVDFIVDRFQTVINVLGDLICAAIVYHINPDIQVNDEVLEFEEKVIHAHDE